MGGGGEGGQGKRGGGTPARVASGPLRLWTKSGVEVAGGGRPRPLRPRRPCRGRPVLRVVVVGVVAMAFKAPPGRGVACWLDQGPGQGDPAFLGRLELEGQWDYGRVVQEVRAVATVYFFMHGGT